MEIHSRAQILDRLARTVRIARPEWNPTHSQSIYLINAVNWALQRTETLVPQSRSTSTTFASFCCCLFIVRAVACVCVCDIYCTWCADLDAIVWVVFEIVHRVVWSDRGGEEKGGSWSRGITWMMWVRWEVFLGMVMMMIKLVMVSQSVGFLFMVFFCVPASIIIIINQSRKTLQSTITCRDLGLLGVNCVLK